MTFNRGKAIVIGAGVAGISAANVLANYFESVVIIDKDKTLTDQKDRTGAPQHTHPHMILHNGALNLYDVFPNIFEKLQNISPRYDYNESFLHASNLGHYKMRKMGLETHTIDRKDLEHLLRKQVLDNKNVSYISAKIVLFNKSDGKVSSIIDEDGNEYVADYFIYSIGAQPDSINKVYSSKEYTGTKHNLGLTYTSATFESNSLKKTDYKSYYYLVDRSREDTGSILLDVNDNKTLISIYTFNREYKLKKHNLENLYELAKKVPDQEFYEKIRYGNLISDIRSFHKKDTWRFKINKRDILDNLLLMGDILCSVNPVYGQGMTFCFKQAATLKKEFEKKSVSNQTIQSSIQNETLKGYYLSHIASMKHGLFHSYFTHFIEAAYYKKELYLQFSKNVHLTDDAKLIFHFPSLLKAVCSTVKNSVK